MLDTSLIYINNLYCGQNIKNSYFCQDIKKFYFFHTQPVDFLGDIDWLYGYSDSANILDIVLDKK
jgi:hypothetical protein